jgi:hypothetical protein
MYSAKYAFVADVECSTPWLPSYDRHSSKFDQKCDQLIAFSYLRITGARLFPKALSILGARGKGAAGPVFLQVGIASVEPTEGHTYDPTDGATTDPYAAVPACASAAVPESANAVASAIVSSFMVKSILAVCR